MSKIPLTLIGAELLRKELHNLKTVERPKVINAIAEARAQGDLSENAEYDAAKGATVIRRGAHRRTGRQAWQRADHRPKTINADGRCVFGATVVLEDVNNGDVVTYQIVGDDEADIRHRKISISSPIARALIGKYSGDIAEVQAPGGIREYEVVEVQYI